MKIAMTLLVRDEIDIIKPHLMYHLPKVDLLVVTDNGSVDGTWEFLSAFKSEKLVLIREMKHDYMQHIWVKRMIDEATSLGADWVINSDADEFWVGDFRAEVERQAKNGCNAISVNSLFFVPTFKDDTNEINPVYRLLHRNQKVTPAFPKMMHATKDFYDVAQGNHVAWFKKGVERKEMQARDVVIYHYWERGWEHFKRKYVQGGEAYKNSKIDDKNVGKRWRELYEVYEKEGEAGLRQRFEAESYIKDQSAWNGWPRKVVKDDRVMNEITKAYSNMSPGARYHAWTVDEHKAVNHGSFLDRGALTKAITLWSPESLIDLGCGEGHYCSLAKELGVQNVTGVDVTPDIASIAVHPVNVADLSKPVSFGKHDLAWCVEVGEHMPMSASKQLVQNCVSHAGRVVFSASPPGQVGIMHISCQPWPYWCRFFDELGFYENVQATRDVRAASTIPWLRENIRVMEKRAS